MTHFAESLAAKKDFVITCELIPGRGYTGKSLESILSFVEAVKGFPAIQAVSFTDNAGGNPALSADIIGAEVLAMGMDAIVHFSCKDMNRNFIESRAFALQRQGVANLLVVSGDYPVSGFLGLSKPVFDLDSVNALHYLSSMNAGLPVATPRGESRIAKTDFFLGASVSPFKWREASLVMQYVKLEKKIRAGARFIITQLGWDARKHLELLQYLRGVLRSDVPVLGSVYVLTAGAAELMGRGEVPGCWVAPEMAALVREEVKAEDKGKRARLERAARQVAVLRGLGYSGAHLEGLALKADDVRFIVERSVELASGWEEHFRELCYAPSDPFYYFEKGEETRPMAVPAAVTVAPAAPSASFPVARRTGKVRIGSPKFWILRALHAMFFVPETSGYRMMVSFAKGMQGKPGLARGFAATEHLVKRTFLECKSCDDCAGLETYYVCPEARCPKGMRVGPCGGSRVDEKCEVYPDRFCAWRDIYRRAKSRGELDKLGYMIPPRNWSLYETGSWFNYFLKRDHASHPVVSVQLERKGENEPRKSEPEKP
jgi:methylenetetrahydrofolate reductase (NADPH)